MNGHPPPLVAETSSSVGRILVKKRLIVCCDGTWMNSDNGYVKPSFSSPHATLQVPSNVTRICRCFKRRCSDGSLQVMSYESGVGTGSDFMDSITGGAFGIGLSERVREAYSYLCSNYMDGDEIFLVGFSRGAFTARSVAGMVADLGLLTREGVEYFYPIFKDMQNWLIKDYDDPFPDKPFPNKPKGPNAAVQYRARLEKMGFTRESQGNGQLIKVKAVCVWDTVGSLGIPTVSWLEKMGIRPSNDEYKWHDTALSDRIEHAFQALALDETRAPFSPAVWERPAKNKLTTDLRQVWFPGTHGNCGGGWEDQAVANMTLAWMMDQMASVGVEFDMQALERTVHQSIEYFRTSSAKRKWKMPWATNPIFETNFPVRPWGLGTIRKATGVMYRISGFVNRTPGLYKKTDRTTERDKEEFLQDTNERIHCSVRVRLACDGLGLDDKNVWTCPAMESWHLKCTDQEIPDPIPQNPTWWPSETNEPAFDVDSDFSNSKGGRWIWEYVGDDKSGPTDPKQRIMVEEPLGPYERHVLRLSAGTPNVFEFANSRKFVWNGRVIASNENARDGVSYR